MSAAIPDSNNVLQLHRRTGSARYSEDVGYDARNSVFAARRLLGGEEAADNPEIAIFAIELLADRAVATPGWETTAKPPLLMTDISDPASVAKTISGQGLAIIAAGVDENSTLFQVTTQASDVGAVVRESEDSFSVRELRDWAREYPYRYGVDEDTPNLFHITTEHFRLSNLPEGPVLVVADTELQQFPPNLFRIDDQFAGQTRPMAATPSLSWLAAARQRQSVGDRKVAWISTAERQGQTLAMIAERLADTFAGHGVELNTGPVLPQGLGGASLAVVAAHGSIAPEGRFFQRVSDEGTFNAHGAELANALRNVGVVILFVCSAGRADKHPAADTTIGLAKELLDRGCSAVIASPWPLDARVTYHWLPKFLEECSSGATIIDANFLANKAVAAAFAGDPAKCLAMTVFGDPLICI